MVYLDKIKYLAKAYTPEIDISSGDQTAAYGISVAMADMFEDTAKNLDEVNRLYQRELIEVLGVHRQEGVAAEGIVSIALKQGLNDSLHIKKDTELYSSNASGSVIYTVKFDTVIKHNAVKTLIYSDATQDKMAFLDHESQEGMLFFDDSIPTIPRRISFRQNDYFIKGMTANVVLEMVCDDYQEWIKVFMDSQSSQWFYVEGEDHRPIKPTLKEGRIYLPIRENKETKDPVSALLTSRKEEDIPYIYVDLYTLGGLSAFKYESVKLGGHNTLKPARLIAKDLEILGEDDFMFGDMYSIYDCFYVGGTTCLSKKGALGTLRFEVDYKKVFKEEYDSNQNVKYKLIMKDEEFNTEESVDIEIEEVIWEYFNGNSWKRLLFDRDSELIFKRRQRQVTIDFLIPEDIKSVFVNGEELHYIRCRIHKINNFAHLNGMFVAPIINHVSLAYDYTPKDFQETTLLKGQLEVFNRYSHTLYSGTNNRIVFHKEKDGTKSVYIGFEEALAIGANTLYFDLENIDANPSHVSYSVLYDYKGDDFVDLRVLDNTDHLSTSGLVILFLEDDMKKKEMFGKTCYWIKMTRRSYSEKDLPILVNRIIPNAVSIVQKEKKSPVYFKNYEVVLNQAFQLPDQHIFETEVFVNEKGFLNTTEYESLLKAGNLKLRHDSKGQVMEEWVRWHMVTSFENCKGQDRVYRLDSNKGQIIFGDNQQGRILPVQQSDVAEVTYSISHGSQGNLLRGTGLNTVESMPSINTIVAVTSLQGGMSIESDQELVERGMACFAHRNRMISVRDIETIVRTSIPQIVDAKCNREPGGISLVVLPVNESYDDFHVKIIHYKVKSLLKSYMGAEKLNVQVLRAKALYIDVKAKIYIKDVAAGQHLVFDIKNRLKEIIEVKTSGTRQHIIGAIPTYQEIYDGISSQVEVMKIESLIVDYYTCEKGRNINRNGLTDQEKMYYVSKSSKHNIILKMDR
jgi:hypothetical protein